MSNDDEEEVLEPNMEFVKSFDSFGSFNKAAGYVEDWIRTKKHNATDFTNDLPAVLERGKAIRSIVFKLRGGTSRCELNKNGALVTPEIRNVQQLIFTKNVYETADEYVFHFTMALLEACCSRDQVPLLVIRITINHLGILIKDGKLKLTAELKNIAKESLSFLRAEVVFDFVKLMGLDGVVNEEYFLKLAQDNITNGKYPEAAILITKFRFFEKFDLLQLILDLVDSKRIPTAKLLIDN